MYCPICEREVESVVKTIPETYPVKGEDIIINAHVRYCSCCNSDIWDDVLDSQNLLDAYSAYRTKHGLLHPEDIRATREKYNLSQTAFARILGLGDKTITRYENGSIPDSAPNSLIFLCQQPSIFKNLLEKNKGKISDTDYQNACNALEQRTKRIIYSDNHSEVYTFTKSNTSYYGYWGDLNYA